MIKTLALDVEAFAARREPVLRTASGRLRPLVLEVLEGSARDWSPLLREMWRLYADTWQEETDEPVRGFTDGVTLLQSLSRTRVSDDTDTQATRIADWLATAVVNAAVNSVVEGQRGMGVEWLTMQDDRVRDIHVEAHGQRRRPGQPFDIGGYPLMYPGHPVGPPEGWINCRCLLRAVEIADAMVAAADAPDTVVVVAVPKREDPVWTVSGDGDPHVTLAFLGEASGLDTQADLLRAVAAAAASWLPFEDTVMGRGVLGADKADVLLIDAAGLAPLREVVVGADPVAEAMGRVKQFPAWIPHLTLGYPDKPAKDDVPPESIAFDSLQLWVGSDRWVFPFGQGSTEEEAPMSDAVTAAAATVEVDDAPPIAEEDLHLPVPWHGVLAPEGVWSGDRRRFSEGALRARDLPLPLKWQPADAEGHRGSVVVGRIDRIWREGGLVMGEGVFDDSPHGYEAVRLIAERMIRGVSVDVDDAEGEMSADDGDERLTFTSARVSAATLVPIPAFGEAYVALGYAEEEETTAAADVDEEPDFVDEEGNGYALVSEEEFVAVNPLPNIGRRPKAGSKPSKPKVKRLRQKNTGRVRARKRGPILRASSEWEGFQVLIDDQGTEYLLVDVPDTDDFAVSEKPWDGSAGRFTPEQWKRSCILHVCDGDEKSCHKLPIREPGGALSRRGVHAAAARIGQVDAPSAAVAAAKRALRGAYRQLKEAPPEALSTRQETLAEMGYEVPPTSEFDIPPARTKDGPGWITHPSPTREITAYWVDGAGRAKIGWGTGGDFNRCRSQLAKYVQNPEWLAGLCANLHYRALGIWPGEHRGEAVALTAAATNPPRAWFTNPGLRERTPLTVTDDGRVYGHLALWESCHVGKSGCVKPPHSASNYAYFHTGEIITDAGPVPVGQITLGGGHADQFASEAATRAHYDSTSTAVADVVAGEDRFGIWFSGALRDGLSDKQVHDLRAAALSGDWRRINGGAYDLIAALAVNVPGFPVPRPSVVTDSRGIYSLTAAAVVTPDNADAYLVAAADRARRALAVRRARTTLRRAK